MPINQTDPNNNQIAITLTAAVATAGTVTVNYPTGLINPQTLLGNTPPVLTGQAAAVVPPGPIATGGTAPYTKGSYLLTNNQHVLFLGSNKYLSPYSFTATFNANASQITITNKGAATWPAGATGFLQLNLSSTPLPPSYVIPAKNSQILRMYPYGADLGSPVAGTATGVAAAQAVAAAGNLVLTGGSLYNTAAAAALFDVPRTLQFVSTNGGDTTQTATITGYDTYGQLTTETVTLNGTSVVTSKKALVSVSKVAISAACTGNISAGASNILGLPLAIYKAGQVLKELQDGAVATAGTFAFADGSAPTATTGDVRGTYLPNSTPNANLGLLILALIPDPSDVGVTNYHA